MIEKVQGEEPTKYVDSKTSKEESIQKRFYIRGLHKKQGRFSHDVDHIVSSQVKYDEDDNHTTITESTRNTRDMPNVDFRKQRLKREILV